MSFMDLGNSTSKDNSQSAVMRAGLQFDPLHYLLGDKYDKTHLKPADWTNKQLSWVAKRDPFIKFERRNGPSKWFKELRPVSDWAISKPGDTIGIVLGAIAGGAALGGGAGGAAGGGASGASAGGASAGGAIPGTVGFNAAGGGFTGGGAVGFGAGGMGSSAIPGTVGLNLGAGGAGGAVMGSGAGGVAAASTTPTWQTYYRKYGQMMPQQQQQQTPQTPAMAPMKGDRYLAARGLMGMDPQAANGLIGFGRRGVNIVR